MAFFITQEILISPEAKGPFVLTEVKAQERCVVGTYAMVERERSLIAFRRLPIVTVGKVKDAKDCSWQGGHNGARVDDHLVPPLLAAVVDCRKLILQRDREVRRS